MKRSMRWRSAASAKPHHAGAAYNSRATVVALVTSWRAAGGIPPCDFRIRRAYREMMWAAVLKSPVSVIPSIFIDVRRSTPGMGCGRSLLVVLLWKMSSFDLSALRRRLLEVAQLEMFKKH